MPGGNRDQTERSWGQTLPQGCWCQAQSLEVLGRGNGMYSVKMAFSPILIKRCWSLCPELKGKRISTVLLLATLSEKWQHTEPWAEIPICTDNNINVMPSFKDPQGGKITRASLSFRNCVKRFCLSLEPCTAPHHVEVLFYSWVTGGLLLKVEWL